MKIRNILLILFVALLTVSFAVPTKREKHDSIEQPISVEKWMTMPFDTVTDFEEELVVEDWMTKPFNI